MMLTPALALAQGVKPRPSVRALKITANEAPLLDGRLDEPVWQRAPVAGDFRQKEPDEGQPATEPTEVRILYSEEALYFGVFCYDSDPESILATEYRRDDLLLNDDTFAVMLDTFHDHRNGFVFRTNSLGTKFDAVITDEERNLNLEWDEKWQTAAGSNEKGWVVEIQIPWATLRSQSQEVQTWGIDFERNIRRKAEETYWSSYDLDYEFWHVSQYGHLEDLEEVRGGLKLRVKPYGVGGFNQSRAGGDTGPLEFQEELDGGLENVKVSITPSITADFTINPDFAQAEVDESVFNLTRFDLFFPEKREFFLEQAGTFDFGARGADIFSEPDMLVFFSRRIGLSEEREPIPILTGARVTGDAANFQFGAMDSFTRSDGADPSANYGVFRLKRKLFNRSYIGGIFTNKTVSASGLINRVGGVDANFIFFEKLRLFGMVTKSSTRDDTGSLNEGLGDNLAYQGSLEYLSDLTTMEFSRMRIDDNFDPQMGFVRRQGVIKHRAEVRWRPRPQFIDGLRQIWISPEMEWFTRQEGFLESREQGLGLVSIWNTGDFAGMSLDRRYEFLEEPFEITPDVTIPSGGYHFDSLRTFINPHSGRRISGTIRTSWGEFFDGRILGATLAPIVKVNPNLSLELGYSINNVSLPHGDFSARVVNTTVNYNFSNRLLTSTTIQHNNIGGGFLVNWRLNYIYRPGDDLFIVYRESRDLDDPFQALLGRTLLIKFTHSFDF